MLENVEVEGSKKIGVSFDLETLDTKPTSYIISIGVCIFDFTSGEIIKRFSYLIDHEEQPGRTISGSTVQWWLRQILKGNTEDLVLKGRINLTNALTHLRQDLVNYPKATVWGNGSTFDISILESAYNYNTPWKYYNVRDMRTIVGIAKDMGFNKRDVFNAGTAHNAEDDAVHQANIIMACYKHITKNKETYLGVH